MWGLFSGLSKRRKVLVYPKFQIALIAANSGVLLASFGLIAFQVYRSFDKLHQMGLQAKLAPTHSYFKFIDFQSQLVYTQVGLALLVAFVLSSITIVLFSHRMAGPLVRLMSHFKKIDETGEYQTLSFRKNDYFTELPPVINSALGRLKKSKREAA